MAIDPVNWRREMKKFVGEELAAIKDENAQLRAEVHALRDEISQIYNALNSIEETTRILAANSMPTNLERNFLPNVESKPTQKIESTKPARERKVNSVMELPTKIKGVISFKPF